MDDTTLKMALAGLIHDIGKLADERVLDMEPGYRDRNIDQYCPWSEKDHRHTHTHALCTAYFIESLKHLLPVQLSLADWGEGDIFLNLAAGHHQPETPLQWIIAMADRISSGWDRKSFDDSHQGIPWREYRKTRLHPLFERLGRKDGDSGPTALPPCYRYPLQKLSDQSIFPVEAAPVSGEVAREEYRRLYDDFRNDLVRLHERMDPIELWFEHFDSLLMIHTSAMPSARAGDVTPDVSLYDHGRVTAALAAALYLYHRDEGGLQKEKIEDDRPAKFLLIGGDFYGIQDFIFKTHGDVRRFRSKLLRGRSFSVSLYSEFAADMICREIGLPATSVLLSAAGKFTILAPNTPAARRAIEKAGRAVNDWLIHISYGQSTMGLTPIEAAPEDFTCGRFQDLWASLQHKMADKKFSRLDLDRHGGARAGYLDRFVVEDGPLCPLCGKRPADPEASQSADIRKPGEEQAITACKICRDQVFMGARLAKKPSLAVLPAGGPAPPRGNRLLAPIYDRYQVYFPESEVDAFLEKNPPLKFWHLAYSPVGPEPVTVKFLNCHIPVMTPNDALDLDERLKRRHPEQPPDRAESGEPKTLNDIAALAPNWDPNLEAYLAIEALGVLKADVDNLGRLMAFGLERERVTISRLATLSRQLNFFFTIDLYNLLETEDRFKNIYTVFAGGDDLFLIGPWNVLLDLLDVLKERFNRYTCFNREIHFSAGFTLHKPHTPVDAMAEAAEAALEEAKTDGKNKITLFGRAVSFADYGALATVREKLEQWLADGWISKSMLYRLNQVLEMAGREKRLVQSDTIRLQDMDCTKWKALLAYSVQRNIGVKLEKKEREQAIQEVHNKLAVWIEAYDQNLIIPLWSLLYSLRR